MPLSRLPNKKQSAKLVIWCKPQVGWMTLIVDKSYGGNPRNCEDNDLIHNDDVEKVYGVFSILFCHGMNKEAGR